MPYYIYAVKPFAQLERLAEFNTYQPASAHAKALRAARQANAGERIKLMFADHPLAAENLLLQLRDPGPSGDD